jgi:hypothetical protein
VTEQARAAADAEAVTRGSGTTLTGAVLLVSVTLIPVFLLPQRKPGAGSEPGNRFTRTGLAAHDSLSRGRAQPFS